MTDDRTQPESAAAPTLAYQSPAGTAEEVEGHWATRSERFQAGLVDWVIVWIGGFAFTMAAAFLIVFVGESFQLSPPVAMVALGVWSLPTFWLLLHLVLDALRDRTLGRSSLNLMICTEAGGIPSRVQVAIRACLQRPWIWPALAMISMEVAAEALRVQIPRPFRQAMPWFIGACAVWWALNAVCCLAQNLTLVDRISRTRLARVELS